MESCKEKCDSVESLLEHYRSASINGYETNNHSSQAKFLEHQIKELSTGSVMCPAPTCHRIFAKNSALRVHVGMMASTCPHHRAIKQLVVQSASTPQMKRQRTTEGGEQISKPKKKRRKSNATEFTPRMCCFYACQYMAKSKVDFIRHCDIEHNNKVLHDFREKQEFLNFILEYAKDLTDLLKNPDESMDKFKFKCPVPICGKYYMSYQGCGGHVASESKRCSYHKKVYDKISYFRSQMESSLRASDASSE